MAFETGWDALMKEGAKMLGKTVTSIVAGVGELGTKILDGAAAIHDMASAGLEKVAGHLISGSLPPLPEAAVVAPKIEAPKQEVAMNMNPHHVDMLDVGHFPAPTFGSGPAAQVVGRG